MIFESPDPHDMKISLRLKSMTMLVEMIVMLGDHADHATHVQLQVEKLKFGVKVMCSALEEKFSPTFKIMRRCPTVLVSKTEMFLCGKARTKRSV